MQWLKEKGQKANNDLQNTTQKTKEQLELHIKLWHTSCFFVDIKS